MKNVLVGSLAALVRDEIHCNEYPGTRWVMSVGYPGSKFSTRFNPSASIVMTSNLRVNYIGECSQSLLLVFRSLQMSSYPA